MNLPAISVVLNRANLNACSRAYSWASSYSLDWHGAWNDCIRGDWLLWLCERLRLERRPIGIATIQCVGPALRYAPRGVREPYLALQTTWRYWHERASRVEVRNAIRATESAKAATKAAGYTASAAVYAAYQALWLSDMSASVAAAYAANAAATAPCRVLEADALAESLAYSADVVRRTIPWSVVETALRAYVVKP